MNQTNLLDHGYVILQDTMGSDLTVVNAARASFHKKSEWLSEADEKLMKYLIRNGHLSPFRHCIVQYEICAPLMVCRQLWRYLVGAENGEGHDPLFAWNEASYRYISQEIQFHIPAKNEWRGAPASKKQGSDGLVDEDLGKYASYQLHEHILHSVQMFQWALDCGFAPEQARLFLPANAIYTTWYMTISLQGLIHLLIERMDGHAQYETRLYAGAMFDLARPYFQKTFQLFMEPDDEQKTGKGERGRC